MKVHDRHHHTTHKVPTYVLIEDCLQLVFFRDANCGSFPFTFGRSWSVPSDNYDSHGRQLHPRCGQPSPYGLLCAF